MKRLRQSKYHYTLSASHKPLLRVNAGETIVVETIDAFGGRIKTEKDLPTPDRIPLDQVNPQSGPIYIEEAEKGDALVIDIVDIVINSKYGVTAIVPDFGGLTRTDYTRLLNDPLLPITRICPIKNNLIQFSNQIFIPVNPMIGTIGVAPESEAIKSLTPGPHGGNMDCPDVCKSNKLMLPIFTKGAFLFLGDVHAAQGDGEISGVGIEVPAECTLKIDVIKEKFIDWPRIESNNYIMTVGSYRPLDDALRIAFAELIFWLEKEYNFDRLEAYQLCSQVAKIRVAQMVDPFYTIIAKFPKKFLSSSS
ncbi:MAG: acetamidase/formamidase family protein [Candidatus Bathyarchaeota archaeon]|nr:acetamidase/formamidase family protein [Candidatus Bathyarchaeota archaeon]